MIVAFDRPTARAASVTEYITPPMHDASESDREPDHDPSTVPLGRRHPMIAAATSRMQLPAEQPAMLAPLGLRFPLPWAEAAERRVALGSRGTGVGRHDADPPVVLDDFD